MNKDNGGPAFPTPRLEMNDEGVVTAFAVMADGMSLRDYFAAKAMQSILRGYDVVNSFEDEEINDPEGMPTLIAQDAYVMADAMLKARGK